MGFFITSGRSLNDKDRNMNADLREIHDFFKPIDNLFGDYEVRKKFGLQELLYCKKYFKEALDWKWKEGSVDTETFTNTEKGKTDEFKLRIVDTKKYDYPKMNRDFIGEKQAILEICKPKLAAGCVIVFFIITDFSQNQTYVDCFFTHASNLSRNWENMSAKINAIVKKQNAKIEQIFIIDPDKLLHVLNLDASRIKAFKDTILSDLETHIYNKYPLIGSKKRMISFCLDSSISILSEQVKSIQQNQPSFQVQDILLNQNLYIKLNTKINSIISDSKDLNEKEIGEHRELIGEFITAFILKNYKLKNFEEHSYFRARIGYANNQYYLFLHPYESESNGPIGFPPQ